MYFAESFNLPGGNPSFPVALLSLREQSSFTINTLAT